MERMKFVKIFCMIFQTFQNFLLQKNLQVLNIKIKLILLSYNATACREQK